MYTDQINLISDSHEELSNPSFRIREPMLNNPPSLDSSSTEDDEGEKAAINNIKAARKVCINLL